METLYLELLGSPQIRISKQPLTGFTTMKAKALIIYLAVTQRAWSRDMLASLFWRDMPDRQAKKNLRNTLPNLRTIIGSHLIVTRDSIAFNQASPHHLDVEVFRSALASPQTMTNMWALQDATAQYRNDFLTGFHVRNAQAFEEWALMEREHLRALAIDGLLALAQQCLQQQSYELGLATTRRLLILDPWRETAHRQQMLLLACRGQRHDALAQYDLCQMTLAEELDIAPMPETTALYEQIKAGVVLAPQEVPRKSLHPDLRGEEKTDWSEFPKQMPLYGRDTELTQLRQWLVVEGASLVGLFGLSGEGKTELAARLAWTLAEEGLERQCNSLVGEPRFERIIWRSLANTSTFGTILQGWLTFLSDHPVTELPSHVDEQLALLFDHLQQQRCLLILDNVECILNDGVTKRAFRPGYEAYRQLIYQISCRLHRSSLLLISQEQPRGFSALNSDTGGVHSMHLHGLCEDASEQLLRTQNVFGNREAIRDLITRYSGHPLALKLVGRTLQELFAGNLDTFLTGDALIFDELGQVFDRQLIMLSPSEKEIVCQLAAHREPVLWQTLRDNLSPSLSRHALLQALHTLRRRSLLETSEEGFSLPYVLIEYLTYLQETVCADQPEETPQRWLSNPATESSPGSNYSVLKMPRVRSLRR